MNSTEKKQTLSKLPPLIAKLKPIAKIQNELESDGNYFILIHLKYKINILNYLKNIHNFLNK